MVNSSGEIIQEPEKPPRGKNYKTIQPAKRSKLRIAADILESIDDYISAFDRNWTIIYMNKNTAKDFGFKPETLIGKNFWKTFPKFLGTDVEKNYRETMYLREIRRFEWKTIYAKMGYREFTVFPSVEGITVYGVDITERKQTEEALVKAKEQTELDRKRLKESEEQYRSLFVNMINGFAFCQMIFDTKGKPTDFVYLEINDAFERLTGLRREDVVGKKVSEAIPGTIEANPELLEIYGNAALTGIGKRFELFFKPLRIWLDISVSSPKKGYFVAVFQDITESKRLQKRIEEYTKSLEKLVEERTKKILESEQSYRELYDSFDEAFIATDWELNVIHWNKAAERVTKVTAKDALGKKVYDVLPEMSSVDITPYFEALQKRKPARFMMNTTSRQTGRPAIFEISTYPSTLGIIIIVEDKTVEEETKRLSAIGQTAGMVGHDIRNPLQSITSSMFLIENDLKYLPESEETKDAFEELKSISEQISYVDKIISDLQDYARPLKPELVEVDIKRLVTGSLATLNVPENIKAYAYFDEKTPKLKTDPTILKRVLLNLATNAVQAMPNGGKLSIHASQDKTSNNITITVKDTGVGIPKELQEKIFKPLFTTKAKGQGLGLAVVKRLIEALNGTITFESQEGIGTQFTIMLPQNKNAFQSQKTTNA